MAVWTTDMVFMLRARIDDLGATPVYTDERLQQIIVVAARDVIAEVDFTSDYVVALTPITISPDPSGINDYDFENLVTLRAACILARGLQKSKGGMGVMIKDGPFNADGRTAAESTAKWADTVCEEYKTASLAYRLGSRLAGKAIVGPYAYDIGANAGQRSRPSLGDGGSDSYFN